MTLSIKHDKENQQFTATVEGKTAVLKYSSPDENTLDYYHTFVPPDLRGRHIGQDLVKFALDFALENNYTIIPSCPFVEQFIKRHPEYKKIIGE